MPDTITADVAITELRKAVDKFGPDHFVEACSYAVWEKDNEVSNHIPNCIVGQVLFNVGYSVDELDLLDDMSSSNVMDVQRKYSKMFDDDAAFILQTAQNVQDRINNSSWGEALREAETVYKLAQSYKSHPSV